jgi:hypothetical protein
MTMKIEINTSAYNERRFGKPWIALVDFADPKGDFRFGQWVGDAGSDGLLIIEAEPGDIVATGQKDNRNLRNSAPEYFQVTDDGQLTPLGGKVEALKGWRERKVAGQPVPEPPIDNPLVGFTTEHLVAELARRGRSVAESSMQASPSQDGE